MEEVVRLSSLGDLESCAGTHAPPPCHPQAGEASCHLEEGAGAL